MGRWAAWWGTWVAALAAILVASPVRAQLGEIGTPLAVCIATVRAGDDAALILRTPQRFQCDGRQTDVGAGDFWAIAAVPPGLAGTMPAVLRSASLFQHRATITFRYADGVAVTRVMDDRAATRHLRLGTMIEQAVPVRGTPLRTILWRIDGSSNVRGVVLRPTIATPAQSERSQQGLIALYAAFGGLGVALLLYNLALWAALRHPFQLPYAGMVASLLLYAFSSSGAFAMVFDEVPNTFRIRLNYVFIGTAAAFALHFARTFFEPRVFAGRMKVAASLVTGWLIVSSYAFALLAPWRARALDLCYAYSFVALLALAAIVLVRAWRVRSNYLWVFAIAWAVPIAMATLRVGSSLRLFDHSFFIDNSTLAAMTAEALLSSVAIAYRLRLLMVERDEARAQESAARLLADVDPLTGLLNRRAFLREAIGREGERLLMVADLDHFRVVNDTLGHDGGDEVLRRFARVLRQIAPAGALIARMGGEEFAALVPADARAFPDMTLAALRSARMPFDIHVTASAGCSMGALRHESDWARLYREADEALYVAKASGRDRVRWDDTAARVVAAA